MLAFIGTFAGAVALHTAWDTFGGVIPFIILAIISLGWLFLVLRHYRAFEELSAGREPLMV
jgi:hypothetical protein